MGELMARIRTVKPELWSSPDLAEVSRDARLLFIGLFNHVDDHGREQAILRQIAAAVFPLDDDVTLATVSRWFHELVEQDLVVLYRVRKRAYFQLTGWTDHQRIDKPSQPRCPASDDPEAVVIPCLDAPSGDARDTLATPSRESIDRNVGALERRSVGASDPLGDAAAPQKKAPPSKKRDLLFETIAQACRIDWQHLTSSARGELNKATKDLKSVGATPDEVEARARVYRRKYENAALTPSALAKHWPALGSDVKQRTSVCPDCEQPVGSAHTPERCALGAELLGKAV